MAGPAEVPDFLGRKAELRGAMLFDITNIATKRIHTTHKGVRTYHLMLGGGSKHLYICKCSFLFLGRR